MKFEEKYVSTHNLENQDVNDIGIGDTILYTTSGTGHNLDDREESAGVVL